MGHEISPYIMLDSRINIGKTRKRSILGQQLQTGKFCCLFPTGPSNHKHELHCSGEKLSHGSFAPTVGCSFIVIGCHVRHKEINVS